MEYDYIDTINYDLTNIFFSFRFSSFFFFADHFYYYKRINLSRERKIFNSSWFYTLSLGKKKIVRNRNDEIEPWKKGFGPADGPKQERTHERTNSRTDGVESCYRNTNSVSVVLALRRGDPCNWGKKK